jgi:capsular exopolysaccharide synthesis family protein
MGLRGDHPDPPLERSTQLEWIRGRVVLSAAIRPPEIANLPLIKNQEDPLDWLVKKLKVEFSGPEVLVISLTHTDADQAVKIVNAITNAYLDRVTSKFGADRSDRLRRLTEYEAEQKTMLKRQLESIRELSKAGGINDTEKRIFAQTYTKLMMSEAQRQLSKARSDLRAGKIREKSLLSEGKVELSDPVIDAYVEGEPRVLKSLAAIQLAEEDYEATRKAGKSPDQKAVKTAEAKVMKLKNEHAELRARIRSEVKNNLLAQERTDRGTQAQKIKADNAFLEEQINTLQNELDAYEKTLSDIRVNEIEVAPLRFEVTQTERTLGQIVQAVTALKGEQDAPARVELMEAATITRVDAAKRKTLMTAGGAAAGLFLALGLVGLLEYRLRRVDSPDAVSHQLGLRVVGTVPNPKSNGPMRWFVNGDAQATAVLTEAIAATRTMLMHGEGLSANRILLITSPVSGEGKTSLSVQLGVSIALAGHKTLVIDGDLRNPTAHERLAVPNRVGLCELLRGEVSIAEAVRETSVAGLHVIPAGHWTADTPQNLVTAPLSQLFAVWREQYEFVILDSSPVLPVTDTLLLARHVDGVILSLLQGVSRLSQANEVCERLQSLGVNVLGVIVNGTAARAYGGSGKYYYTNPTPSNPEQA